MDLACRIGRSMARVTRCCIWIVRLLRGKMKTADGMSSGWMGIRSKDRGRATISELFRSAPDAFFDTTKRCQSAAKWRMLPEDARHPTQLTVFAGDSPGTECRRKRHLGSTVFNLATASRCGRLRFRPAGLR